MLTDRASYPGPQAAEARKRIRRGRRCHPVREKPGSIGRLLSMQPGFERDPSKDLVVRMIELKIDRVRFFVSAAIVLLGSALTAGGASAAQEGQPAAASPCSSAAQSAFPKASITNGAVQAVVYLPDAKNGYYRGSRFDWSGVVPCLAYKGHTYFGIWFSHYDPMIADAIAGPVEEFRSSDGALNYGEAKPGELFVKPGVGVLRKIDDSPYKFMAPYPLVDGGKWTVRTRRSEVSLTQHLNSSLGIAYVYQKTLKLDKREPVLLLEHEFKNTGTRTIEMEVYDHDFFMLDGAPTAPGMVVRFPFEPKAEQSMEPLARIEGKQIVYLKELPQKPRLAASSYLTGYSDRVSDYDITVEDQRTGVGVEQTSDMPISRFNFWSIHTTICPEAYIHLNIPPGQTAHWTIRYRFYAK